MKICFLVLFLISCFTMASQDFKVQGRISDYQNNPVSGANVLIYPSGENRILTYAITDGNGEYEVAFNTLVNTVKIEISFLGFKKSSEMVTLNNKNTTYNRKLQEDSFDLDQVIIKTQKIRDTMRLPTDSLVLSERSTLRDILDQTEGFMVSDDGAISFRGKQIQKILINKKEVFINQNKTALDNLDYGIMDDVQLINNYRDKFDINFDNFTESVINVDTKKEFKGILKTVLDGALGFKEKYLFKIRGFYFSDELNAFLTSNTNNIGKKGFTFKDLADAFKEQSSILFRQGASSFFLEDDLIRDAFDSNTSFTFRKEGRKYRAGLVIYYNNMQQLKTNTLITTEAESNLLAKIEEKKIKTRGNLLSSNLRMNYMFGKNTILNINSDVGYTNTNSLENLHIQNFINEENSIDESLENSPESVLVANHAYIKTKLTSKSILTAGLEQFHEKSDSRLSSIYTFSETTSLFQNFDIRNSLYKGYANMEIKHSNLISISLGTEIEFYDEKVLERTTAGNKYRNGYVWTPYFNLRGQEKQWQYNLRIAPQVYTFYGAGKIHNRKRPVMEGTISHEPNGNNRIWTSYQQTNQMPDLYNDLDSLTLSFNERLINNNSINKTVSSTSKWTTGYSYSNISKSQSLNVSYGYIADYDNLTPVFEFVENNVFYYRNYLIDKRVSSEINLNASKGFYFSKNYHKIIFSAGTNGYFREFPTIISSQSLTYKNQLIRFNGGIALQPRKFILDEFKISAVWDTNNLILENENINTQKRRTYLFNISKKSNKVDTNLSFGFHFLQSENVDFTYPFLNLDATIKLNDKLNVFVQGKNLFHLMNIVNTDNTGLSIVSEGNFVNKNINQYNLNYLLFGLTYKP